MNREEFVIPPIDKVRDIWSYVDYDLELPQAQDQGYDAR